MLFGIGVSPGITIGEVYHLDRRRIDIPKYQISRNHIEAEMERFKKAIQVSKAELTKIKKKLGKNIGESYLYIIDTHILILQDELLIENTTKNIKDYRINAEWAFRRAMKHFSSVFENMDDEYLKERKNDIEQIGNRILNNLIGNKGAGLKNLKNPVVIVAHYLSPAEAIQMSKEKVLGIATDMGSKTSHSAIVARALHIPTVVGLKDISKKVSTGDSVIVDGGKGVVVINPEEKLRENYSEKQKKYTCYVHKLEKLRELPAKTKDGFKIDLLANIEHPDEIHSVIENGAVGIGLYRTEYLFLQNKDLPSEKKQFENYKDIAEKISPYPAVIRTLDIGGDKLFSSFDMSEQMNSSKGLRAIRFCLHRQDIFKTQLRAILRASHYGRLKILLPLITSLNELNEVKKILAGVKKELDSEKIPYDKNIETGVMIETPAAALVTDILAKEAAFFSIGSNDLTQYALAVDRNNEQVAYLYEPLHPGILRMIKAVADVSRKQGISLSVCGEMGRDPLGVLVLLGLGIDTFSMNPFSIPRIKKIFQSVTLKDAKNIAKKLLKCSTAEDIKELAIKHINRIDLEEFDKEDLERKYFQQNEREVYQ